MSTALKGYKDERSYYLSFYNHLYKRVCGEGKGNGGLYEVS